LLIFSSASTCSGKSNQPEAGKSDLAGKQLAPLSLSYETLSRADIGEKISIAITCQTLADVEALEIRVKPVKGLELIAEPFEVQYGNQAVNFVFTEMVEVIAQEEGVLYLNVFVSGVFDNNKMVRSTAIPVNVGNNPKKLLKRSGKLKTTVSGQRIISLPATE